jgi:hypothetical protein
MHLWFGCSGESYTDFMFLCHWKMILRFPFVIISWVHALSRFFSGGHVYSSWQCQPSLVASLACYVIGLELPPCPRFAYVFFLVLRHGIMVELCIIINWAWICLFSTENLFSSMDSFARLRTSTIYQWPGMACGTAGGGCCFASPLFFHVISTLATRNNGGRIECPTPAQATISMVHLLGWAAGMLVKISAYLA